MADLEIAKVDFTQCKIKWYSKRKNHSIVAR